MLLCDVYPLRFRGRKLSPEQVRERVRRGWLEVERRDDGAPVRIARLHSERGSVRGELLCVTITKVARGGLMVTGWEPPLNHRQAWWCVPVIDPDPSGRIAAEENS